MKRKEAVLQLAGYLSTYVWYEERSPSDLIDLAEHALNGIEKIGMKPPSMAIPCFAKMDDGTEIPIGNQKLIYVWEPEYDVPPCGTATNKIS